MKLPCQHRFWKSSWAKISVPDLQMSKLRLACFVSHGEGKGESERLPKRRGKGKGREQEKNQPVACKAHPCPREGMRSHLQAGDPGQLCLLVCFPIFLGCFFCNRAKDAEEEDPGLAGGSPLPPSVPERGAVRGRLWAEEVRPNLAEELKARIPGRADSPILRFQPQIPRLLTSQHLLLTCQMPLNLQIKPLITDFLLM